MQKWEYLVTKATPQQLNELGGQGWELIFALRDDDSNVTMWVLKRAK
jgi:hypothetical protein